MKHIKLYEEFDNIEDLRDDLFDIGIENLEITYDGDEGIVEGPSKEEILKLETLVMFEDHGKIASLNFQARKSGSELITIILTGEFGGKKLEYDSYRMDIVGKRFDKSSDITGCKMSIWNSGDGQMRNLNTKGTTPRGQTVIDYRNMYKRYPGMLVLTAFMLMKKYIHYGN